MLTAEQNQVKCVTGTDNLMPGEGDGAWEIRHAQKWTQPGGTEHGGKDHKYAHSLHLPLL